MRGEIPRSWEGQAATEMCVMSTLTTKGTGAWGVLGACVAHVLRTTPTWGRSWVLTCWFLTNPLRAAPETFWFSGISNLLLLEGILQDVDTAWGDISRVLPDSLAFRQYNAHLKYYCLNANWYRHCELYSSVHFSHSVVSDSATPWTAACQASLSITNSQSLFKLMSIGSVMPSNRLILCRPLLLLPSIFPSIRVFSSESTLRIRWPKYWSFSFSISPSNEQPGNWSLGWIGWISL